MPKVIILALDLMDRNQTVLYTMSVNINLEHFTLCIRKLNNGCTHQALQ